VMVLLGGVQTLVGPIVGSAVFTWLQDWVSRATDYWRALLGVVILLLVIVFPQGIAGGLIALAQRIGGRREVIVSAPASMSASSASASTPSTSPRGGHP